VPATRTFDDIEEDIREALRGAYGDGGYVYLADVSPDGLVWFEVNTTNSCQLMQASWSYGDGDDINLGPAIEVEREVDVTYSPVSMSMAFDVVRKDAEQQLIFGWANVSVRKDGTLVIDSDGENVPIEDLELAAYQFTMSYRETGEDHAGEARGTLVESVVFTEEKCKAMGIPEGTVPLGWWTGFYLPDPDDFGKVKSGAKGMFSIQGRSRKVLV
jgi:hypothetical protein